MPPGAKRSRGVLYVLRTITVIVVIVAVVLGYRLLAREVERYESERQAAGQGLECSEWAFAVVKAVSADADAGVDYVESNNRIRAEMPAPEGCVY